MSPAVVTLDTATPRLQRLAGWFEGRGSGDRFLMRWGARVRRTAIDNAIAKGGRHFWRQIARSINLEQSGGTVTVEASHVAAAQKQYGGVIKAKGQAAGGADFLTIPIAPEAEGQSAIKFTLGGVDLFAIMSSPDRGVLGHSEDGEFAPLFALVRETAEQKPDPFMPDADEAIDIGEEEAIRMIRESR